MARSVTISVLAVALCICVVALMGCNESTPTVTSPHLSRQAANALSPSVWGPLVDPMTGIRVDGTDEMGNQLYFFIGAEADTIGFWTSIQAAASASNRYWMPK
jgi:hypothetical protein